MPILLETLRQAAGRAKPQRLAKSVNEAVAKSQPTAFLCHSHKDGQLAEGLQVYLAENGWDVYIDWKDNTMPSEPDRETAETIKRKIANLDWFLFLATPNSTVSRWCPWEIGYADKQKQHKQIVLIRTGEAGNWYGNEYLQLYREITYFSNKTGLAIFPAGENSPGTPLEKLR